MHLKWLRQSKALPIDSDAAMQRLDLKSLRYDRFGKSVLIEGRKVLLEIPHEALEAMTNRALDEREAVEKVVEEQKRFTRLAEIIPADDGKINITTHMLLNDGMHETGD